MTEHVTSKDLISQETMVGWLNELQSILNEHGVATLDALRLRLSHEPCPECATLQKLLDKHSDEIERKASEVVHEDYCNCLTCEARRGCLASPPEAVTATEALLARKPLDIALGRLSMSMGNPAVHWNTSDSTIESALVDEATRRLGQLQRLAHSTPPPGAEWQPMETAPKDGRSVLLMCNAAVNSPLYRDGGLQFVGKWVSNGSLWCFAAPVGYGGIPDAWLSGWMPLPASRSTKCAEGSNGICVAPADECCGKSQSR